MNDDWEQEFHLTPNGWIPGCFFFRGALDKKVVPPDDRVLTLVMEGLDSPIIGGLNVGWRYDWKSKVHSQAEIDRLLAEFGHRPMGGY